MEPWRAPGMPRRRVDRLVEVVRLDQVEAAQGLLRLGERTVGRDRPAVPDLDGGRRGRRMERLAGLELPALAEHLVKAP